MPKLARGEIETERECCELTRERDALRGDLQGAEDYIFSFSLLLLIYFRIK